MKSTSRGSHVLTQRKEGKKVWCSQVSGSLRVSTTAMMFCYELYVLFAKKKIEYFLVKTEVWF